MKFGMLVLKICTGMFRSLLPEEKKVSVQKQLFSTKQFNSLFGFQRTQMFIDKKIFFVTDRNYMEID